MEHKTLLSKWHTDEATGFRLRHVKSTTERFRPHDHDYYEFFLVLRGYASHVIGDDSTVAGVGDLIFVRDFDVHDYKNCSDEDFEFLNLAFTRKNLDAVADFLDCRKSVESLLAKRLPPVRRLSIEETEKLHLKLASLLSGEVSTAEARRILADVFIDYFISDGRGEESIPYWLKNAYRKMSAPKNFLLGTARFFELCDKTREHATRQLALHYGTTPAEYVLRLKLSYAAGLLQNSNLTVSEVAYNSGFSNLSTFCINFRRIYAKTPKEYRRDLGA